MTLKKTTSLCAEFLFCIFFFGCRTWDVENVLDPPIQCSLYKHNTREHHKDAALTLYSYWRESNMQCFIKCMFISESSLLCLTRANKQLEVRLQCTYWMSNDERICIHPRDPRLTLISHLYSYHAPLGMSKQNNPVGGTEGWGLWINLSKWKC